MLESEIKYDVWLKLESLDWGSNEGREGGREARGDT